MAKVVIYSKDPCPYCVAAKKFLQNRGIEFQEIDLTGKDEEINKIKATTGWQTMPIIMINEKLIGGFTDLKTLEAEGKLEELLGS